MEKSIDGKAIIIVEILQSIEVLQTIKDPHIVVHEIRKSLKKIRSYLRLIKEHINFQEENTYFRDMGLKISDIRDISSSIEALEALKTSKSQHLPGITFANILNHLSEVRNQLARLTFEDENVLSVIEINLKEKFAQVNEWDFDTGDLEAHLNHTILQVRNASIQAKKERKAEDFHEWRKKVKNLRYQVDVLGGSVLPINEPLVESLHQLSDVIGWDHDLVILETLIIGKKNLFKNKTEQERFFKLLNQRKSELKKQAIEIDESELEGIYKAIPAI